MSQKPPDDMPFAQAAVQRHRQRVTACFLLGDGNAVQMTDRITLPNTAGSLRAGTSGIVVLLDDDGVGLRFEEKIGRVTREYFGWSEIVGTTVERLGDARRRKSITPPIGTSISP